MHFSDRLAFYERRYLHEIDLREKLEGRTRTSLLLLGIVAGVLGYVLKSSVLVGSFDFHWSLFALLGVGSVTFIAALLYCLRSMVGYHYQLLPASDNLEAYYQSILEEFKKVSAAKAREWANEDFEQYLMEAYISYASQNTRNNDAKSLNLHRCLISLAVTFTCGSLALLPYYLKLLYE